jgi:hypothetical protein
LLYNRGNIFAPDENRIPVRLKSSPEPSHSTGLAAPGSVTSREKSATDDDVDDDYDHENDNLIKKLFSLLEDFIMYNCKRAL